MKHDMLNLIWRKHSFRLHVFTDGAIRSPGGMSGLGVVVQDDNGRILGWLARRAQPLTCNEAEYEAVIFALEQIQAWRPSTVIVFSDSRIVVDQARGLATARAPALKQQLGRLRAVASYLPSVTFQHIPRERNRLADALANDVADGYVREGMKYEV
jgi:ribonuclease HI